MKGSLLLFLFCGLLLGITLSAHVVHGHRVTWSDVSEKPYARESTDIGSDDVTEQPYAREGVKPYARQSTDGDTDGVTEQPYAREGLKPYARQSTDGGSDGGTEKPYSREGMKPYSKEGSAVSEKPYRVGAAATEIRGSDQEQDLVQEQEHVKKFYVDNSIRDLDKDGDNNIDADSDGKSSLDDSSFILSTRSYAADVLQP